LAAGYLLIPKFILPFISLKLINTLITLRHVPKIINAQLIMEDIALNSGASRG
jgi:hypothetical protein